MDWFFGWMLSRFKDYVINNWPTSAAGVIGALATQIPALAPYKEAIITITVALVGLLAKTATVTGSVVASAGKALVENAGTPTYDDQRAN